MATGVTLIFLIYKYCIFQCMGWLNIIIIMIMRYRKQQTTALNILTLFSLDVNDVIFFCDGGSSTRNSNDSRSLMVGHIALVSQGWL